MCQCLGILGNGTERRFVAESVRTVPVKIKLQPCGDYQIGPELLRRNAYVYHSRIMFSRSRKKFVAWIALFAVIFAAFAPASFANALNLGQGVDVGGICHSGTVSAYPGDPLLPTGGAAAHEHCAFCTIGAPLVAAHRVVAVVALLDLPHAIVPTQRNDALPPDAVAFHPLSPRAPPRAH